MSFGVKSRRYGRRRSSLILKPEFLEKLETKEKNSGAAIGWITNNNNSNFNSNSNNQQQYKKRGRPSRYSKQKRKVYKRKHQTWVQKESSKKDLYSAKTKGQPKKNQFWWKNSNQNETTTTDTTTMTTASPNTITTNTDTTKNDNSDNKEKEKETVTTVSQIDDSKQKDNNSTTNDSKINENKKIKDVTDMNKNKNKNENENENKNESDEKKEENKLISVRVITGFHGKYKTEILESILTNADLDLGKKIGIILNDMKGTIGNLLNKTNGKEEQNKIIDKKLNNNNFILMKNGILCCNYYQNNDIYKQFINTIKEQQIKYIILESPPMIPTMEIAESFAYADVEDEENTTTTDNKKDDDNEFDSTKLEQVCNNLSSVAKLDTMVSIIDVNKFDSYINSVATFSQQFNDNNNNNGEEDDNNVSELLLNQIEYANVIIIGDGMSTNENKKNENDGKSNDNDKNKDAIEKIKDICNILNNKCKILCDNNNKSDINENLFITNRFNFSEFELKERKYYDYLTKNLAIISKLNNNKHSSKHLLWFKYTNRKPFDPWKLYLLIKSQILENIIIANGILWIATQNDTCFEWTQYGLIISFEEKCPWLFVTTPIIAATASNTSNDNDNDTTTSITASGRRRRKSRVLTQDIQQSLEKKYQRKRKDSLFVGSYGDRRQEILFIGYKGKLNPILLEENLDACLISDNDFKRKTPKEWKQMKDPFQREFDSEEDGDEDEDDSSSGYTDDESSQESQISDID